MDSVEFRHYGNDIVAYDKRLFSEFPIDLFNPEFLSSNPSLRYERLLPAEIKGRAGLHLFSYRDQTLVLRHYHRGGKPAKLTRDAYLWCGLHRTRAMREFRTLFAIRRLNLPAPVPVAAHIRRGVLTYRADIITRFIPQARSLSSRLVEKPLAAEIWHQIGVVIRRFHDKHCHHADLNAHNILLDEESRVFLVDFDKAFVGRRAVVLRGNNLARLQRSLLKLKGMESSFGYSERDFESLLEGYASGQ